MNNALIVYFSLYSLLLIVIVIMLVLKSKSLYTL
nr:MAG TPA: hypothetical protein [Caudoviricetes sp.]